MTTVRACRYKNGRLGDYDTVLLPHAAEHLSTERRYDTVILLNFVEHVMDAFRVYHIAFRALKPGGLLVFHERFWPGYDGRETRNEREFDLHPVRLNERVAHWMATEFDLLYEKEQTEEWGNLGYYWIGRKPAVPMARYVSRLRTRLDALAGTRTTCGGTYTTPATWSSRASTWRTRGRRASRPFARSDSPAATRRWPT